MSIRDATHAYIGIAPCGCTLAAVIDSPGQLRDTAKAVYGFILDGLAITRIRLDEVRHLFARCPHAREATSTDALHLYEVHHFVTTYVAATSEAAAEAVMDQMGDAVTDPIIYDPTEGYLRQVTTVPNDALDTYVLIADDEPRTCREILEAATPQAAPERRI